jgi:hypothetical protein
MNGENRTSNGSLQTAVTSTVAYIRIIQVILAFGPGSLPHRHMLFSLDNLQ